jgi:hypothetical protein
MMKSLLLLWEVAALELGGECQTSTDRDFKTVCDRVKCEGLSFLTITLPQFCSDFQKSLDQGFVATTSFAGFRRRGGLPTFLSGFLCRIFSSAGRLLDAPCISSIIAIRQLTLLFSKIELECSQERVDSAFAKYIECERSVRENDENCPMDDLLRFDRISRLLFGQCFSNVDSIIYAGDVLPRHGPGSTADHLKGNQKYNQSEWTLRLEKIFPASEFLFPSRSNWREAQRVTFLEPGAERPVRVITVPKTLKTPRIIAIEPTCMQYMQQAVLDLLVHEVSSDKTLYHLMGFDDQTPNQVMAKQGSFDGSLATLDLSEASDRVSNQLVRRLLANHPWLFQAVDATRSRKADVPGFGVIRLAKFASMGSALCFPFEAMVFLTVCFIGIEKSLNRPLTKTDINRYLGRVRVYGDDIIIPVSLVSLVVSSLETFGFKVNLSKSFWTGKFRESCGKEYYDGHDVSIVKVRTLLPARRADVQALVSTVALRNLFYTSLMWQCVRYLDAILERFLKNLPRVAPTSPSLGLHSYLGYDTHRMDEALHSPLVRGYAVVPKIPRSPLNGNGALLKFFLKRGVDPHSDGHLERSGRPTSVDIRRRWIRPY